MTAHVDRSFARVLRFLARACVLLAVGALPACGSSVTTIVDDEEVDAGRGEAARVDHDGAVSDADEGSAGRAVEVFESGTGDATVVFESGFGNDWTPWQQVAAEVAMKARVFAYSRPGYGQSERTDEPRDALHIVDDLRTLLATRGYAPPYVLVGHSFGGAYMELFAKAYPREVAGLVLVDPRHRDFTTACEEADYAGCSIPAAVAVSLPPVQIAELEAFAETADQIRAAGTFGALPVRVLTATSHGFDPEVEALWVSMLGSLAAEAENGEQKIFDGAGHSLELERPRDVAEAVLDVVLATAI